jgi:hypothetical protein
VPSLSLSLSLSLSRLRNAMEWTEAGGLIGSRQGRPAKRCATVTPTRTNQSVRRREQELTQGGGERPTGDGRPNYSACCKENDQRMGTATKLTSTSARAPACMSPPRPSTRRHDAASPSSRCLRKRSYRGRPCSHYWVGPTGTPFKTSSFSSLST